MLRFATVPYMVDDFLSITVDFLRETGIEYDIGNVSRYSTQRRT